ncbi:hypothetical protein [Sphingorhabdus sp. M41]|uniref:hypothetical protein n=1 Tax=Sphingorhabdus sp. M41 TaxID=1806885 RepID=UPI0012E836F4|nr:hypothetical protein [Sphingorhabdus sp. M41]
MFITPRRAVTGANARDMPVYGSGVDGSEFSISTIFKALIASSTFIAGIAKFFSSRKFNTS